MLFKPISIKTMQHHQQSLADKKKKQHLHPNLKRWSIKLLCVCLFAGLCFCLARSRDRSIYFGLDFTISKLLKTQSTIKTPASGGRAWCVCVCSPFAHTWHCCVNLDSVVQRVCQSSRCAMEANLTAAPFSRTDTRHGAWGGKNHPFSYLAIKKY